MSVDIGKMESAASSGQGAVAQVSVEIMKQIQDVAKQQGQALVGMINQSTQFTQSSLDSSVGGTVNRIA